MTAQRDKLGATVDNLTDKLAQEKCKVEILDKQLQTANASHCEILTVLNETPSLVVGELKKQDGVVGGLLAASEKHRIK